MFQLFREGILNNRKEKKIKKKKGSESSDQSARKSRTESGSSEDDNSSSGGGQVTSNSVHVDDEGYIIRETTPNTNKNDVDSFYSSSDDDSDEEEQVKKFHIEIKPIHNSCGPSVAQLRETVKSLSISPSLLQSRRQVGVTSTTSTPEDGPLGLSNSENNCKQDNDVFAVLNSVSNTSTPSIVGNKNALSNRYQALVETPTSDSNASEDRYAALRAIFTDSSTEETNTTTLSGLSKSMSSSTVMGPPLSTIPKPPSKKARVAPLTNYTNQITRCKSYGNLSQDSRMTPISIGSSRGPSPLTIGMCDVIPIAVAMQELVTARFKGSDEIKCQIDIYGSLKIAFPAGIIQVLTNNPSPAVLSFKLTNTSKIEKCHVNKDVLIEREIKEGKENLFEVNMTGLTSCLKRLFEQSPSARYYNVDMLKYKMKTAPGAKSSPLHVITHWKCDTQTTGLKVDYKYNPHALSSLSPLRNVTFTAIVDGNVTGCQSKPSAEWNPTTSQLTWKFDKLSRDSEGNGLNTLRAKFDVTNGPSSPSPVVVKFSGNDLTFSGLEFELVCPGYRISLNKKLILSGRYVSEADHTINYASV